MRSRNPDGRRRGGVDFAITASAAVIAGVASRWIFDAPAIVIAVLAACVLVLMLAAPETSVLWIVLLTTASAVIAQLPRSSAASVVAGVGLGLAASLCIAVPLLIASTARQRRAFRRRGWALAAAEADRQASEVQAAVQRERMALAADMHDGLGHSLTLIAVRLGHLSLDRELPGAVRTEVADVRRLAADAAEELGVAVRLLRSPDAAEAGAATDSLEDLVANARDAGVTISLDAPPDLDQRINQETSTALTRAAREALTNAAKHAPSAPVHISIRLAGGEVALTVRNPVGATAHGPVPSTGFGLIGIRHRASLLGGSLDAGRIADEFILTLRLPLHARPTPHEASDGDVVRVEESEALRVTDRAARKAFAVPAALASALAFVALAFFLLSNLLSVLPPESFAEITAGDDRATTERALPPLELLDPPRDLFPARDGEECRYYEASVSFFDRVDVHVVCFDGDAVSRTGEVTAG